MASSSRMTAAMTCSCTSALSSVPALGRCVKARRSPTKSWQIVALANLRPTICAPPDKRISSGPVHENTVREIPTNRKGRADRAAFFIWRSLFLFGEAPSYLAKPLLIWRSPFLFGEALGDRRQGVGQVGAVVTTGTLLYVKQANWRGLV